MKTKRIEFIVITNSDIYTFASEVQKRLQRGWKFHGTIWTTSSERWTWNHQAMIKGL